jgi:hypothetical protein
MIMFSVESGLESDPRRSSPGPFRRWPVILKDVILALRDASPMLSTLIGNLGEHIERQTKGSTVARSDAAAQLTEAAGTAEELTGLLNNATDW